jgi:hypothetical protein
MFIKEDKSRDKASSKRLAGALIVFISPIIPCITLLKSEPTIAFLIIAISTGVAISVYTGKGMFKIKE